MYKLVVLFALIVCSQSAPTEGPIESNPTVTILHAKTVPEEHKIVAIKSLPTENREKREDVTSSSDNRRTPAVSQPDYQDNKPPTFVHPVPVDQIIKNSNASPEIHSSKHVEEEQEEEEVRNVEQEDKVVNEDETTEQQHKHHKHAYSRPAIKTNVQSSDDDN